MTSRFLSGLHDPFDAAAQVEHAERPHYEKEPAGNSSTQEGMNVSHDNPNTYEDLISYYFTDPSSSYKQVLRPVYHSKW